MDIAGTVSPPAPPPMRLQITLVDLNAKMAAAWRQSFEQNPEVRVVHGSMLDQRCDAWVSPTNAQIRMDGGLDAAVKNALGKEVEAAAQRQARDRYGGSLPVGCATCVATGRDVPRYLVSTPTMRGGSEDVSATMNVALACVAAIQAVRMHNATQPTPDIYTLALPGLGAGTGSVPPEIAADLMWTAYDLMKGQGFADFAAARKALAEALGEVDPIPAASYAAPKSPAATGNGAVVAKADEDFDDFD